MISVLTPTPEVPTGRMREIRLGAQVSLLHLAVRDAEINQDGAQFLQIGAGLVRRRNVRRELGDDLHQRHAAPVVVHLALVAPGMNELAGVLFQMDTPDVDALGAPIFQRDVQPSLHADGVFVLRDLIPFGQVGIKIVLAREQAVPRNLAVQRQRRPQHKLHGLPVHGRQRAGQPQADGAGARVGRPAELVGAPAEHLAPGQQFGMALHADHRFISGHGLILPRGSSLLHFLHQRVRKPRQNSVEPG